MVSFSGSSEGDKGAGVVDVVLMVGCEACIAEAYAGSVKGAEGWSHPDTVGYSNYCSTGLCARPSRPKWPGEVKAASRCTSRSDELVAT